MRCMNHVWIQIWHRKAKLVTKEGRFQAVTYNTNYRWTPFFASSFSSCHDFMCLLLHNKMHTAAVSLLELTESWEGGETPENEWAWNRSEWYKRDRKRFSETRKGTKRKRELGVTVFVRTAEHSHRYGSEQVVITSCLGCDLKMKRVCVCAAYWLHSSPSHCISTYYDNWTPHYSENWYYLSLVCFRKEAH